ncbi:hypothetical protein SAMN06265795_1172 [Noviherbaspirillum humi]|uniref:Uncharacterized protein n=1 Tax=Noviherbaspirillum humi TaxID=1688639 RepID=A0A239KSV5_9BURK|nr:hypothetical protein [Noviherbaspirillum humi]SNT20304.1 hypothetical protein SAMN06265795_1172 [Noviherbaspirillum humi]
MHALPVIEQACLEAIEEDTPEGHSAFRAVVDPESILELVKVAQAAWTDEEKKALGELLRDLTDFARRSPISAERDELVQRSKMLRGLMEI